MFVSCHIWYPLFDSCKVCRIKCVFFLFYSNGNTRLSAKKYYFYHFSGVFSASKNLLSIATDRIEYSEIPVTKNNAYSSSTTLCLSATHIFVFPKQSLKLWTWLLYILHSVFQLSWNQHSQQNKHRTSLIKWLKSGHFTAYDETVYTSYSNFIANHYRDPFSVVLFCLSSHNFTFPCDVKNWLKHVTQTFK